jgi:hypothetical protein
MCGSLPPTLTDTPPPSFWASQVIALLMRGPAGSLRGLVNSEPNNKLSRGTFGCLKRPCGAQQEDSKRTTHNSRVSYRVSTTAE